MILKNEIFMFLHKKDFTAVGGVCFFKIIFNFIKVKLFLLKKIKSLLLYFTIEDSILFDKTSFFQLNLKEA